MQVHGLTLFLDWSPYAHACIIFGRYEDGQVGDANINTQDPKIQKENHAGLNPRLYVKLREAQPRTTPVPQDPSALIKGLRSSRQVCPEESRGHYRGAGKR